MYEAAWTHSQNIKFKKLKEDFHYLNRIFVTDLVKFALVKFRALSWWRIRMHKQFDGYV